MFITQYNSKADNWNLMRILKKREMNPNNINDLPKLGYLVYQDDHLVAAGFMRQCEGGYGMFDSYLTDPRAPSKLRDQALEMITKSLISKAKDIGVRHLIAFSVDEHTLIRSQRHGFVLLDHKLLAQVL